MVINGKAVQMDERVWRQLLALPYSIEVNDIGQIVMTALQQPAPTYEQLATTHPILPNDLAWKVETNAANQIIMSPGPSNIHQEYGLEIVDRLRRLLRNGRAFYECGVVTADGTKIPDVGWISKERRRQNGRNLTYHVAPEICVEVISLCNTRDEIDEKARLYFGAGTLEVWRCQLDGTMTFADADGPLERSRLCPDFPAFVELPD